ncbi:hypothetical protein cypCar_00023151 [Cyprinus carpio]|nr:hypothetical protein cypCar_00023151 [Cyprinus carpio]
MLAWSGCCSNQLGGSEQRWQWNGQHRIQGPQRKKTPLFARLSPFCLAQCRLMESILYFTNEMLYFIGLGLGDAKYITVKGLEIVRQCSRVYLEDYTSIL